MTSNSSVRVGESRRLVRSSGSDDGTPRPREVAIGAGLGGFAAIVLLVVSAVLSGGGQHTATVARPGASGDGTAGVATPVPDVVGLPGQDARDAVATASAMATRPPAHSDDGPRMVAAGATSVSVPVEAPAPPAGLGPRSDEPMGSGSTVSTVASTPAVPPSASPEPGTTAGVAVLIQGSDSSSPASPGPEPAPSCPEDRNFAGSLLRSLGLAPCVP